MYFSHILTFKLKFFFISSAEFSICLAAWSRKKYASSIVFASSAQLNPTIAKRMYFFHISSASIFLFIFLGVRINLSFNPQHVSVFSARTRLIRIFKIVLCHAVCFSCDLCHCHFLFHRILLKYPAAGICQTYEAFS